jgi:hypothetical protein
MFVYVFLSTIHYKAECNLPKLSSVLSRNIEHGFSHHTTFPTLIHMVIEGPSIWPIALVITTAGEMKKKKDSSTSFMK